MSDLAQLMEELPGGPNHGRRSAPDVGASTSTQPLGAAEHQAAEFMRDGGWTIASIKDGSRAGVHAHRGVIHEDEHVDLEALRPTVEDELGFTYEQVHSVYRQGPLSADQRELRARIDARLLALSRSGANLLTLARILGLEVKANRTCRVMENALTRAREAAA